MLFPLLSRKQSPLEQRLIQACSLTSLWLMYSALDGVNVHKLTVILFQRNFFKKQSEQLVRLQWPAVIIFYYGKVVFQLLIQFKRNGTKFRSFSYWWKGNATVICVPIVSWEVSRYPPPSCVAGRSKNCTDEMRIWFSFYFEFQVLNFGQDLFSPIHKVANIFILIKETGSFKSSIWREYLQKFKKWTKIFKTRPSRNELWLQKQVWKQDIMQWLVF